MICFIKKHNFSHNSLKSETSSLAHIGLSIIDLISCRRSCLLTLSIIYRKSFFGSDNSIQKYWLLIFFNSGDEKELGANYLLAVFFKINYEITSSLIFPIPN